MSNVEARLLGETKDGKDVFVYTLTNAHGLRVKLIDYGATVISDEIPQILEGIPLRVRDIRVRMNHQGFTVAPTDCSAYCLVCT